MGKMKIAPLVAVTLALTAFPCPAAIDGSLIQGFESYRSGDWTSATLFLRRAVTSPQNSTPEAWYMLVMSQVYNGDFSNAVTDCGSFEERFPENPLLPYVQYQKGRALHFLGRNDSAVLVLSDFCHQNPGNELYPSALFWIAECFFADYNFETARSLYERIVSDYSGSVKASDARERLDAIAQHDREEKLLYLLKMTGEEYLSSRENYEKQLKKYQTEDLAALRRQLNDANARIKALEREASGKASYTQEELELMRTIAREEGLREALNSLSGEGEGESEVGEVGEVSAPARAARAALYEEIMALKSKASKLQALLDQKKYGD